MSEAPAKTPANYEAAGGTMFIVRSPEVLVVAANGSQTVVPIADLEEFVTHVQGRK